MSLCDIRHYSCASSCRSQHLTALALILQDVLVVTAPGSGAEVIPFLKTWVNLPMAIGFTVLYAKVMFPMSICTQLVIVDLY